MQLNLFKKRWRPAKSASALVRPRQPSPLTYINYASIFPTINVVDAIQAGGSGMFLDLCGPLRQMGDRYLAEYVPYSVPDDSECKISERNAFRLIESLVQIACRAAKTEMNGVVNFVPTRLTDVNISFDQPNCRVRLLAYRQTGEDMRCWSTTAVDIHGRCLASLTVVVGKR